MNTNKIKLEWLFFSICFRKEDWTRMLVEAIGPFRRNNGGDLLQGLILHFGVKKGEYIGLSCLITSSRRKQFIKEYKSHFVKYLTDCPSIGDPFVDGNPGLYMPIQPNWIYQGLHSFVPSISDQGFDSEYLRLWCNSSTLIIDLAKNYTIEPQALFNHAVLLNFLLLNSQRAQRKLYIRNIARFIEQHPDLSEEYSSRCSSQFNVLRTQCQHLLSNKADIDVRLSMLSNLHLSFTQYATRHNKREGLIGRMILDIRNQFLVYENDRSIDYFVYHLLQHVE